MIYVALPAALARHVAEDPTSTARRRCVLEINAGDWPHTVDLLREEYPELAERVLSPSGLAAHGIALVLNDTVVRHGQPIEVKTGDRVSFVPQIAGGTLT
jgi:molybdopterin converting factor small subunit